MWSSTNTDTAVSIPILLDSNECSWLYSIILRAFQGIGAAGTYALSIVILFELVPPEKYASYTGLVSMILAVGLLLGPILGGVINNGTTWRWVFYLK